jgi:site-specific DNA-cytosine methylase
MELPFINTKPVRLIELFGGIGSQAMALTRLGVNFEHYRLVEFDKYSVKSYNAIHGTAFEPTDITKIHGSDLGIVDTDHYCYNSESVAMCLTAQPLGNAGGNSYLYLTDESNKIQQPSLRIRKLTPKECYRLMGFDDEAFERAAQVNSNAQLYKQAGNSIVVDVLMAIFDNLLVHGRSVWLDKLLKDEEV